jgi:colanic acid/amylovoran biosynthesis glycosyltransferase
VNKGSRVGFLISQYPAGNHALLMREVRELRRQGVEIATCSISLPDRPGNQLTEEEREEAARTFYAKSQGATGALAALGAAMRHRPGALLGGLVYTLRLAGRRLNRLPHLLLYFAEALILGRWMEREGLTHLHVQYSSTVGLLLKQVFPVDLSASFHGPDEFRDPEGFWLREKIEACVFVRAISNYARSQLMQACGYEHWDKIEVCYMGVDPARFERRPFRADPRPFEILCVGRLAPVKAQHVLIDTIGRLRERGRDVLLHLAGGGPDKAVLTGHAKRLGLERNVIVHGFAPQDKLDDLYRQADVFALASFAEGVPGVLMEAMSMGIPCVATWITGVPELIRNGRDGLLAAPSDVAGFADLLDSLVTDAGLRKRVGEAGRERIMEQFHLEKNCQRLAGIFAARAGIKRGGPECQPPAMDSR